MPQITDLVQFPMSRRQALALARIDAEDFSLVVYKTKKDYSERGLVRDNAFFDIGVTSLKQYYSTTVFDPYNLHAVADDLDRFWHQHVIDTARYSMLCADIKGFMHHDPLDRTDLPKVCAIAQVYEYTYKVLEKIYGVENLSPIFFPPRPEIDILVCRHDVDTTLYNVGELDDAFPIDPQIAELRRRYGNDAKMNHIRSALARAPARRRSPNRKT